MNEEIEIEKRLARQYRRVAHRHKGLVRFPDEFKSKEQLKKEEQEKGYRYLSNQDADTMVCDGANLICSHCKFSNIGAQDNPYTIERKYEKFIRFNVPDYMAGTFLMGGNAAGTTFCVHADNFDPNPELECQEGGKCAIKAFANEWTNVSQLVLMNGFEALTKDSVLTCKKYSGARITVLNNGQNADIQYAWVEKALTDVGLNANRRKKILIFVSRFQFVIGLVEVGGGIFTGNGLLVLDGARNMFDGVRSYEQLTTGEDILVRFQTEVVGIPEDTAKGFAILYDGYEIFEGVKGMAGSSYVVLKKVKNFSFDDYIVNQPTNINARELINNAYDISSQTIDVSKNENAVKTMLRLSPKRADKFKEYLSRPNKQAKINKLNISNQGLINLENQRSFLINSATVKDFNYAKLKETQELISDVITNPISMTLSPVDTAKSVADLKIKYLNRRFGTSRRIIEKIK